MEIFILLLVLAFIGWCLWLVYENMNSNMPAIRISSWNHYFADLDFSARELYTVIQENVEKRKIPEAHIPSYS